MKVEPFIAAALLTLSACSPKANYVQSNTIQLSQPLISIQDYFFEKETTVSVGKSQETSEVRYTEGELTPGPESSVAGTTVTVKESKTLRFRSIGGGFLSSDEVVVEVIKLRPEPLSLTAASFATPPYARVQQEALVDRQKAGKDFRNDDWIGYQRKNVTFVVSFPEIKLSGVTLSVLEDQRSWLFTPVSIKATFYSPDGQELRTVSKRYLPEIQKTGSAFRFLTIETTLLRAASVKLEVENLPEIPVWHPGAGNKPWLFVDEILIR